MLGADLDLLSYFHYPVLRTPYIDCIIMTADTYPKSRYLGAVQSRDDMLHSTLTREGTRG